MPYRVPSIFDQIQKALADTGEPYTISKDPSIKNRFYVRRGDSGQTLPINVGRSDIPGPAGNAFLIASSTGRKQTAITGSMSAFYSRESGETNFEVSTPVRNLAMTVEAAFSRVSGGGQQADVISAFNSVLTLGDEERGIPRFPSISSRLPAAASQKVVGQMAFMPSLAQTDLNQAKLAPWEVAKTYDAYKSRTQYGEGPIDQFSNVSWNAMRAMQPGKHGNLEPVETDLVRAVVKGGQVVDWSAILPNNPLKTMKARTTSYGRETAPPWQQVGGALQPITPAEIRGSSSSNVNYALSNVLYPGERTPRPMELRDFVVTPDILMSGGAFAYQNRRDVRPTAFGPESFRTVDLQVGNLYEFGKEGNTMELNKIVGRTFGGGRENATIGNRIIGENQEPIKIPIGPSDYSVRSMGMTIPPYMNETTGAPAPAPGPGVISSANQAKILSSRLGIPVNIGEQAMNKVSLSIGGVQIMGGEIKTPGVKFGSIPVPREMNVSGGGRQLPVSYVTSEVKSDAFIRFGFFGARSHQQTAGMFREYAGMAGAPQGASQFADWFGENYSPTAKGKLRRADWDTLSSKFNQFTGQNLTGSQLANTVFENVILSARGDAARNARNIEQYEAGFLDAGSEISHGPASPDYIASLQSASRRDYLRNVPGATEEQFQQYWGERYRQGETPEGAAYPELMQKLSSEAMWMRSAVQRVPEYSYRTRLNPEAQMAISTAYPDFAKTIGVHPTSVIQRSKSGVAFDELRSYVGWQTSAARGELGGMMPTKFRTVSADEAAQMYTLMKQGGSRKEMLSGLQGIVGNEQMNLYFPGSKSFFPHPSTISDLVFSKFGKEFAGLATPYTRDLETLAKAEAQGFQGEAIEGLKFQQNFFTRTNRLLTTGGEAAKASLNVNVRAAMAGGYNALPALRSFQVGALPDTTARFVRGMGVRGEKWVDKIAQSIGSQNIWGTGLRYPQAEGSSSMAGYQFQLGNAMQSLIGKKAFDVLANDPQNAGNFYTSADFSQANTGDQDRDKGVFVANAALRGRNVIPGSTEEFERAALTHQRAQQIEQESFSDPALRDKVNALVGAAGDARENKNVLQKVINNRGEYSIGDVAQSARDRQLQATIGIGTGYDIRRAIIPAMGMLGYSDQSMDTMLNAMPASYQIPLDFMSTSANATGTDVASMIAGASLGMSKSGEGFLSVRTGKKSSGRPQSLTMTPASLKSGDYLLDFLSPAAQLASNATETRSGKSYNLFGGSHLASMFGLEDDQAALAQKLEGMPATERGKALTTYLSGIGAQRALGTPFMGGIFARVNSKAQNRVDLITGEEMKPGTLEALGQFNEALGPTLSGKFAGASVWHDVLHRWKTGLGNFSAKRITETLQATPPGRFMEMGTSLARKMDIPVPLQESVALQEKVLAAEGAITPEVAKVAENALGIKLDEKKRAKEVSELENSFDFAAMKNFGKRARDLTEANKGGEDVSLADVKMSDFRRRVDDAVEGAIDATGGIPEDAGTGQDGPVAGAGGRGGGSRGNGPKGTSSWVPGGSRPPGGPSGPSGGGGSGFFDKPPSPTKANLMVERAYAKLGKVSGRASKLDFFVKDVMAGLGVDIDTQPMDQALHQVLSTQREEFVGRIGPARMKEIVGIGKVRDQASQAFGNIGYSRYVEGTEQYNAISGALGKKSPMYNMALLSGVMAAGEGANPYTMGALQDMEGNEGFRGLSKALQEAGFTQGNIPGAEQTSRIQGILSQNPQYKTLMNQATRLSRGVPSDLVPTSVSQVAQVADAVKRLDPSILKESASTSSASTMALPEGAIKRLNALYKEQEEIMNKVSSVKGTEIQQLKTEYDIRSKEISSIKAPYRIEALGKEIAGLEALPYSADVERKIDRARGLQSKMMDRYAAESAPEPGGLGQLARHTLGGFGLMYLRSIGGIVTGGLGGNEQERMAYDQMQAQMVGQATGGRIARGTQSQELANRLAMGGINNNPLEAMRMLGAKVPALQGVFDVAAAGVGTFGVASWLSGDMMKAGGSVGRLGQTINSNLGGIAGLAMASYAATEVFSRTQDPQGMSRRMGMLGGGAAAMLSPFDFLAVGAMGWQNVLTGKEANAGQVGKVVSDMNMIANLQNTMASGASGRQIRAGFGDVPTPDLMASMMDIANQNGYAPEHNARAVSFLMRQGNEKLTQENINRWAQDYASGIASEDLAAQMLTAGGFNATRQFSRTAGGTEVLGGLTSSLRNRNLSSEERTVLQGGIQAASQLPGVAFVPGVGAMGGKQVDPALMDKFFTKLESLVNTPAFGVYQQQLSTWQSRTAAGLTSAPAPLPDMLSPEMGLKDATAAMSKQQALQNQAQNRLNMASNLQSRSYGFGNEQLGDDLYKMYNQVPVGQEWFYNKLYSGDQQAFGAVAAKGLPLSKMPGLKTLNGDRIGAEYAAYTDMGLNGQLTGLNWGSTSFRLGDVSGETMAGRMFGENWKTSGQFDTGAIQAGVSGFKLPSPITLPNGQTVDSIGGTMGMNLYAAQMNRDQQLAQFSIQSRGMQAQLQYTQKSWGIQDQQVALQNAQQQWQFGFQQRQLNQENSNWNQSFNLNMRQTNMQRAFTRQEWGFNAEVRDMQWGWQQEDFQSEVRFTTGRQRKIAERGQKRATIMHEVEGEGIERQQNQQKQLWRLEDERFSLEKTQHAQSIAMQQESLDKNREFWEQNKKLQDQERKLSREYFMEQHKLQQQSTNLQVAYAKRTFELQKTFAQLETAMQLTKGQINNLADDAFEDLYKAMVKANPKLKEMIDQILRVGNSSGGGTGGTTNTGSGTGSGTTTGGPGTGHNYGSMGVKVEQYLANQATTYSTKPATTSSSGYYPLVQATSQKANEVPVNINLGGDKIGQFVIDVITKEVRNG